MRDPKVWGPQRSDALWGSPGRAPSPRRRLPPGRPPSHGPCVRAAIQQRPPSVVMLSASGHVGLWVCCVDSAVLGGGGDYGHLRAAPLLLFAEHERLVPSSALNFKINEMLCLKSKQRYHMRLDALCAE